MNIKTIKQLPSTKDLLNKVSVCCDENGNTYNWELNDLNLTFIKGEGKDSVCLLNSEEVNTASGDASIALGAGNTASGFASYAEGKGTIAHNIAEHASGIYNDSTKSDDASQATHFSIGIGTSDTDRKNAFEVKKNGDIYIEGVENSLQSELAEISAEVNEVAEKIDNINPRPMISVTYAELVALRDNGELVAGMQYRITDYTTTTVQENTQSAGHQFDVIVIADDVNVLNENARAIQHEEDNYFANSDLNAWELKYCLDNDSTRFAWADTENGKGVIYRMVDEFGNDCPYDFKNIQFLRRISLESGKPTIDDSKEEAWVYTFCAVSFHRDNGTYSKLKDGSLESPYKHNQGDEEMSTFHHNVMMPYMHLIDDFDKYENVGKYYLNNNVLLGYYVEISSDELYNNYPAEACYNNTFGNNCDSNTFGLNCHSNTFGDGCNRNTFGNGCQSNSFGNGCSRNSFGINCSDNIFGTNSDSNTFGNACNSNSLGDGCNRNTFGNGCQSNSFDNDCSSNSFGNNCHSNSLGNDCDSNSFGDECTSNSFSNEFFDNTFGNYCSSNSFGNHCHDNSFGEGYVSNSFGNECSSNSFGEYCCANTLGDSCSNNSLVNYCSNNSFGNYCESNTLGDECNSNSFGNECISNSFGNDCANNSFGNDCDNNSFGDRCYFNSFSNNCHRNSLGYTCDSNSFGDSCQYNNLGGYCKYNSFGNGCYFNSFGESKDNPKSYYRHIIFDNGNRNINLNCTSTTSSTNYFQNVRIGMGVNNATIDKTINDSNVNQTYETLYKPANSQTITI